MTQNVSTLTWVDTTDNNNPVAPYTVNFAIDLTWRFLLLGSYHFQPIAPGGMTLDNSANAMPVIVTIGPYSTAVAPYQRQPISLPGHADDIVLQCSAPQSVSLEFWVASDEKPTQAVAVATQQPATITAPAGIALNANTNTQMIAAGISGHITGFTILAINTTPGAGGAAAIGLQDGVGTQLWQGGIAIENITSMPPVVATGISIPFTNGVVFGISGTSFPAGSAVAVVLWFIRS